jgi:MoxR-like ATPase
MTTHRANPFVELRPDTALDLPATDRLAAAGHLWSQPEIDALIFAWAARRPLLVRGEAGSGKSQIARAAACALRQREPIIEVIHARFEALDLLYTVDLVERLADAQLKHFVPPAAEYAEFDKVTMGSIPGVSFAEVSKRGAKEWTEEALVPQFDRSNEKYVKRGAMWRAFDGAVDGRYPPVLLVDEIDKADADVPNALLEVLGNRSFTVPPLNDRPIGVGIGGLPLVIITTNEERELPPAFVRRCAVLNLNPPKDEQAFTAWLVKRGQVHRHLDVDDFAREEAAIQVLADRSVAAGEGYPPVGLAEYIDLLTALDELAGSSGGDARTAQQRAWLQRLSAYALVKNADQDQGRNPVQIRTESEGGDPPAGP